MSRLLQILCLVSICSPVGALADARVEALTGGPFAYRERLNRLREFPDAQAAGILERGRGAALERLQALECQNRTVRAKQLADAPGWGDLMQVGSDDPAMYTLVESLLGSLEERRHAYWMLMFQREKFAPIRGVIFLALQFQWLAGSRNEFVANYLALEAPNWPAEFVHFLGQAYRTGNSADKHSIHALLAFTGMANSDAARIIYE